MMEVEWIHLLFRGDRLSRESPDEYITEFESKKLTATTVPALKFDYKNLDQLARLLEDLTEKSDQSHANGLIITSPRVVEALFRATHFFGVERRYDIIQRFNSELVFIVGEKSARECETRLGLKYNIMSSRTGNGQALAKYISTYCNDSRFSTINLLYPEGSRADSSIEDVLTHESKIFVKSIVVYETNPIDDIRSIAIEELKKLNISTTGKSRLIINMIFFSPSGVEGFLKTGQDPFNDQVQHTFPNHEVEFRYSSIGKTTEAALLRNNLEVFCVSDKPNPSSLVESLMKSSCDF